MSDVMRALTDQLEAVERNATPVELADLQAGRAQRDVPIGTRRLRR